MNREGFFVITHYQLQRNTSFKNDLIFTKYFQGENSNNQISEEVEAMELNQVSNGNCPSAEITVDKNTQTNSMKNSSVSTIHYV